MSILSVELNLCETFLMKRLPELSGQVLDCYNLSDCVGSLSLQLTDGCLPLVFFNSIPTKPQKRSSSSVKLETSAKPLAQSPKRPLPVKPRAPNLCDSSIASEPKMFNELFNAQGEKFFMCIHCSYSCNTKSPMVRHVELKHNPNAKKFPCTMCPLQAKFGWQLKAHHVKVHNLSETAAKAVASEAWWELLSKWHLTNVYKLEVFI